MKAPRVVKKLFDEIAPRYTDRPGGYTRIVKLGRHRLGDGADLCVLQLVREDDGGPQVGGRGVRKARSRRRMEYAAELRKKLNAGEEASADEAPVEQVEPVATEEAAPETPADTTEETKKDE